MVMQSEFITRYIARCRGPGSLTRRLAPVSPAAVRRYVLGFAWFRAEQAGAASRMGSSSITPRASPLAAMVIAVESPRAARLR
jgi:hypothetical protein